MQGTTAEPAAVVRRAPDEGEAIWVLGSLMTGKLDGAVTGGSLEMQVVTQPPGTATPLHVHRREAEAFFLLEGEMRYEAGGEPWTLGPEGFIYLPQGIPHRFRIVGPRPARFLAIVAPAGLFELYRGIGEEASERRLPGPPRPEHVAAWLAAAPGYGIEVLGPPMAEGA